jgi:hypothetical protein
MVMQNKTWMTTFLFKEFQSFFKNLVSNGISQSNTHLLILDGHGSHVTLKEIGQAQTFGLYMITLPSHTSHALQSLDVSCFKPFKIALRKEREIVQWSKIIIGN